MIKLTVPRIANELNQLAASHPIGKLQEIRKEIKHLKQRSGSSIFTSQTTRDNWAFHHGGRKELQFNIGDEGSNSAELRHGVAIDFSPSQTLPDPSILFSKASLLSELLGEFKKEIPDMCMWKWEEGERTEEVELGSFPDDWIKVGNFLFFGKQQRMRNLNRELILNDFDRLLPLYQLVERARPREISVAKKRNEFRFQKGLRKRIACSVVNREAAEIEVEYREGEMQKRLYQRLVDRFGQDNVGTENATCMGTKVDVVVRSRSGIWYYEIKAKCSPRECLRQAIGQLLEYSLWPGSMAANRLTVVGEAPLDSDGKKYLQRLRRSYSLPLYYEHIPIS